jgi:hypothetical protein
MKRHALSTLIFATLSTSVRAQDPCFVCGEGKQVGRPEELYAFPNQPAVRCRAIEQSGLEGRIPKTQCGFLPGLISTTCGCQPSPSPKASPVASPVSDLISNNDEGDCVCYGSVNNDRSLLTRRNVQKRPVYGSLREIEAKRKKRQEALRVLQGEEDDCECIEVCDDDEIREDDEISTGKKGKGGSGKGTSSGKKGGKGNSGKGTHDDDGRDDDGISTGKKSKGGSGKGTSSGKKGKGNSGKGTSDDDGRDDDGIATGKKGKGGSDKGGSDKGTSFGKKGKGNSGKGTPDDDGRDDDGIATGKKGKGGSGKGSSSGKKGGKGDFGRQEDDCVCDCFNGECKCQNNTFAANELHTTNFPLN